MTITSFTGRTVRAVTAAALLLGTVAVAATPTPAEARVSTGAAVGIGLGAFALGSALGAANPYYGGYGYYGYPGYSYPTYPAYSYPAYGYGYAPYRSCNPYYGCY